MKEKILYILWMLLIIFFLISLFIPLIYWFNNDYFTSMQIFKKFWILMIVQIIIGLAFKIFKGE